MIGPILRAASYGDEKISPSVVAFSEKMMHDTPIATLVGFLHALEVHDETRRTADAGEDAHADRVRRRDLLTPMEYSEDMADALPKSELVIIEGAGHLVQLEQPEIIDDALVRLVERATPSKLVALHPAPTGSGAQPWLSDGARHGQNCRPPRTPSRWVRDSGENCVPVTSSCCPGPLGAGKTVLAKGIAQADGRRRRGRLADVRAGPACIRRAAGAGRPGA